MCENKKPTKHQSKNPSRCSGILFRCHCSTVTSCSMDGGCPLGSPKGTSLAVEGMGMSSGLSGLLDVNGIETVGELEQYINTFIHRLSNSHLVLGNFQPEREHLPAQSIRVTCDSRLLKADHLILSLGFRVHTLS